MGNPLFCNHNWKRLLLQQTKICNKQTVAIVSHFVFNISNVIIFYDDIDLPFGEIKMSYARSSGGHNGVESVIKELGSKDFYRIRVGIGSKPHKDMLLQDYVLMKMSEDEISFLQNDIVKNKVKSCLDQIIGEIKSKNK
jgi:PTH1 family peptidyl-tRNA hydrolase